MKWIFTILALMVFVTGCTKKEFKTNFHNVKTGAKKDWKTTKQEFSKQTNEYKNH